MANIVQSYLHSEIRECYYREKYLNFNVCFRLNKEQNIVEQIDSTVEKSLLGLGLSISIAKDFVASH